MEESNYSLNVSDTFVSYILVFGCLAVFARGIKWRREELFMAYVQKRELERKIMNSLTPRGAIFV